MKKQLRVAIVGGGYAGLACALRLGAIAKTVHVYALEKPGCGGASSQSAGLMHPLNKYGAPIWNGNRGYEQSRALMDSLQVDLSASLYEKVEIVRPMISFAECRKWRANSIKFPNTIKMVESVDEYVSIIGTNQSACDDNFYGAARLQYAVVVNSKRYLLAMWRKVQNICDSTEWIVSQVDDVRSLSAAYDIVILCCGSGAFEMVEAQAEARFMPLLKETTKGTYIPRCHLVKASNLLIPQTDPPLKHALLRGEYLIPVSVPADHDTSGAVEYGFNHQNGTNMILCGSAQENSFGAKLDVFESKPKLDSLRELSLRLSRLYPPIEQFFSDLEDSSLEALVVTSGIRVMPEKTHVGRLPIIGRHHSLRNVWFVVGLGARGLIYHDILSEHVVQAALENNGKNVPVELYYRRTADK